MYVLGITSDRKRSNTCVKSVIKVADIAERMKKLKWQADELRRMCGVKCMQIAQDRQEWKRIGEAYIQQWMVNG
jgi:hypothetical protein